MFKNVKFIEFYYDIWNHHVKCIEISTTMPGIGLVISEIRSEFQDYCLGKLMVVHASANYPNVVDTSDQYVSSR